MLDKHLIASFKPLACPKNILFWKDYRVTILTTALFRLEKSSKKKYRDLPTQIVWFRNLAEVDYKYFENEDELIIETKSCKLILKEKREDCRIELNGELIKINNDNNLLGTGRTLDGWDGDVFKRTGEKLPLEKGVCSRSGVALFDDATSLSLGEDGEVKEEKGDGSDEYIFAYGNNYRQAVKALYQITGFVPLIPRYALGNWWSRYHPYTERKYLSLLNEFEENDVPLTIATIDMDWHYSNEKQIDQDFEITSSGKMDEKYIGSKGYGWTGYTWNKELFPDYQSFLQKIKNKNLFITLNLHPADGVRYWEDAYDEMAKATGVAPETKIRIPFDITDSNFINHYFSILHKPYEKDGVDFWWIDWQQGMNSKIEGLDPLWALNHYHFLDHKSNHQQALILSRYSGIGSHRYPIGFSGDTFISWDTLKYLPYFTLTASNIGYTWWSHDIGAHQNGIMENELYLRFIQLGVFSPINRLHCSNWETMTKEPWAYLNGTGLIAMKYLRLRHQMIPYLYSSAYKTHKEGIALVEPLYYQWEQEEAYIYKEEFLFGSELLVIPVTNKKDPDGFARVNAWIPEGKWTDIFTKDEYQAPTNGLEKTLYRELDFIPVLAKAGAILPFSKDEGNSCDNPEHLEIWSYLGNNEYTLYEDGYLGAKQGEFKTIFKSSYEEEDFGKQSLYISSSGNSSIIPEKRKMSILFKNIEEGCLSFYKDSEKIILDDPLRKCLSIDFIFEAGKNYLIEVKFELKTKVQKLNTRARKILISAEGINEDKQNLYQELFISKSLDEYLKAVDNSKVNEIVKLRLKETL